MPLDPNQSTTLSLLNALSAILTARNALITTWVSYETARMSLYRDFDLMDIDANGVWTNENDPTAIDIALRNAQSFPAFLLTIPARIPDLSPGIGSDSTFYVDVEPGGKPNQPPAAGRSPIADEQPDTPIGPRGGATGPPRPEGPPGPAPPGLPSPFAPPGPPQCALRWPRRILGVGPGPGLARRTGLPEPAHPLAGRLPAAMRPCSRKCAGPGWKSPSPNEATSRAA